MTRLLRQFAERGLIRMRGSTVWIRDEPLRTTPSGTHKSAGEVKMPSARPTGKGEGPRRR